MVDHAPKRFFGTRQIARPLVESAEQKVRFSIQRVDRAEVLEGRRRGFVHLGVELLASDQPETFGLPQRSLGLLPEQREFAAHLGLGRVFDFLAELARDRQEAGSILLAQLGQYAEHGAVLPLGSERGLQARTERLQRVARRRRVVRQIAIGPEVERHISGHAGRANQERALLPQRVAHTKLVVPH